MKYYAELTDRNGNTFGKILKQTPENNPIPKINDAIHHNGKIYIVHDKLDGIHMATVFAREIDVRSPSSA